MSTPDTSTPAVTPDLQALRERLWAAVIDRDEYAAAATVCGAVDAAVTPEDVLLDVIAHVQHRVGTEWAANRITVAQEHAATAINDHVIALLSHHPACRRSADMGRVTVACVDGEWHALPARLLAEVLRLRGWDVDFLGAHVPTPHLIAHLHQHGPDAVAVSCSIPTLLPTAHAAIAACQSAGVRVLAGGAAFGTDGRYAHLLGADAWAPDARAAAERLSRGFAMRFSSDHPRGDLPHLADQEYPLITARAAQLVKATVDDLADLFPAMRTYTDLQRQHTTEDIAYIVDFLATAIYTDDDELFTNFITWTASILEARRVPAASLHPALDLLAAQLQNLPRAQRMLHAAHDSLNQMSFDPTPTA
ncbi:cobalamin B12-binding domain-containing protein [Mycobacterium sp. B14F4]|uniref:cobalamin B12-binding domain-containing protein n=1 Tax=Mycobacterium sp. B14F4 TaxID=3153565 RepID=UPI00325E1F90